MKHNRLLSLALAFLMMFSMAIIPVSAEDEIQYTESDLHEMTSYADAVAADHVNRLTAEEAPNTLVFANADNTKTMYYYGEDIKYTDENGNVRDKTNELTYSNGTYVNEDNDINVALPVSLADGVTLTHGDFEITMTPGLTGSGSLSTSPATALFSSTQRGLADTVTYHSALGSNVSIRYTPMYSGLKEDIILSSYTGVYSFSFLVETGELLLLPDTTLDSDDDSMFEGNMSESPAPIRWYFAYNDDPMTPVAWFSDVYIYDSAGATAMGSISAELLDEGSYALTVTADRAFLESSSTVYPVTIDPTVTLEETINSKKYIEDSVVYSSSPSSNYGNSTVLLGNTTRSIFLKFPGLSENQQMIFVKGSKIARFYVSYYSTGVSTNASSASYSVHNVNDLWDENTITYNNMPTCNSSASNTSSVTGTAGYKTIDISNSARQWENVAYDAAYHGVKLTFGASMKFYSSEVENTSYKPYLMINYDSAEIGIYQIRNVATTNLMNVATSSTSNNADVYQYEEDYTVGQAFRIVYNSSSDTHKIYSVCSEFGYGYVIRQQSGDEDDIASGTYTSATGDWNFILSDDGSYNINLNNTNYYISVSGSGNKSDIHLNTSATTDNERWTFELIDDDGCANISNISTYKQTTSYTCSMASSLIALSAFNIEVVPSSSWDRGVDEWLYEKYCPSGAYAGAIANCINYYLQNKNIEYSSRAISTNVKEYWKIFRSLNSGYPVIILFEKSSLSATDELPYTTSGHFAVISGIVLNSSGNGFDVVLKDPYPMENFVGTYTIPLEKILDYGRLKNTTAIISCWE